MRTDLEHVLAISVAILLQPAHEACGRRPDLASVCHMAVLRVPFGMFFHESGDPFRDGLGDYAGFEQSTYGGKPSASATAVVVAPIP